MIIYGFLFAADDMIDNSTSKESKKIRFHDIKKYFAALFDGRYGKSRFKWVEKAGTPKNAFDRIDWNYFEKRLSGEELAIFKAFSRIASYLPHEPFYGFLESWNDWDIEGRIVQSEQDLVEFGSKAYGCGSDLTIYTYYYKMNQSPDDFGPTMEYVCEQMWKFGAVCYFLP